MNTIRVFRAGDSDVTAIGYELIAAGVTPAGINGLAYSDRFDQSFAELSRYPRGFTFCQ